MKYLILILLLNFAITEKVNRNLKNCVNSIEGFIEEGFILIHDLLEKKYMEILKEIPVLYSDFVEIKNQCYDSVEILKREYFNNKSIETFYCVINKQKNFNAQNLVLDFMSCQ